MTRRTAPRGHRAAPTVGAIPPRRTSPARGAADAALPCPDGGTVLDDGGCVHGAACHALGDMRCGGASPIAACTRDTDADWRCADAMFDATRFERTVETLPECQRLCPVRLADGDDGPVSRIDHRPTWELFPGPMASTPRGPTTRCPSRTTRCVRTAHLAGWAFAFLCSGAAPSSSPPTRGPDA